MVLLITVEIRPPYCLLQSSEVKDIIGRREKIEHHLQTHLETIMVYQNYTETTLAKLYHRQFIDTSFFQGCYSFYEDCLVQALMEYAQFSG